MKTKLAVGLCSLLVGFGVARTQEPSAIGNSANPVQAGAAPQAVQPPTAAPDQRTARAAQQPPPAPVQTQAQPQVQQPVAGAEASPGGQWV